MPHEPTPLHRRDREPGTQWLGPHHEQQLRNHLAQLPELLALVAVNPQPLKRGNTGPRPTPGSRPPLSLHAITLTDRRTRTDDIDIIGLADLERTAGRRNGIEPTIRSWVLLAEGEMLDEGVAHTDIPAAQRIGDDCAWLARHIVWILEQQWVIELAQVVRRAVQECEQHLHIRAEYRPTCPKCGGRLADRGTIWRCDDCGHTPGDERLTLRQIVAAEQPMTVGELVRAFGWSTKTVESWIQRGHLQPADIAAKPRRYHVLDALRLADAGGASQAP